MDDMDIQKLSIGDYVVKISGPNDLLEVVGISEKNERVLVKDIESSTEYEEVTEWVNLSDLKYPDES